MVDCGWTFLSRPRWFNFYVSRHFSYPRDAKFCDKYASKGLVFITSLLGEKDWSVVDTLSWFHS